MSPDVVLVENDQLVAIFEQLGDLARQVAALDARVAGADQLEAIGTALGLHTEQLVAIHSDLATFSALFERYRPMLEEFASKTSGPIAWAARRRLKGKPDGT